MIKWLIMIFLLCVVCRVCGQENDSIFYKDTVPTSTWLFDSIPLTDVHSPHQFKFRNVLIPSIMIAVGAVGLESDWVQNQNNHIRDEVQEHAGDKIKADDYLQYIPMLSVYGLNIAGIKGEHDFVDRTIILSLSAAMMASTVNILKNKTRVRRPDGSTLNSFPSGHTATAFMGAEFLRREYRNTSIWIGVTGYIVATTTSVLRMYNNRHWFTDVLAGAGFGVLSTETAYWIYPTISKFLFPKKVLRHVGFMPYYNQQNVGLACSIVF